MTPSQTYTAIRNRLVDLASTMDSGTQDTPVPALPGWTVDTYAHLAGICADALDGRLKGIASEEWTAGQVAERSALSIVDVSAEWSRRGPDMDVFLASPDGARSLLIVEDAWQHEQDIRGALGLPGDRNEQTCTWMAEFTLRYLAHKWPEESPAVRIIAGGREWTLGEGTPTATLSTDLYALARLVLGRRSRAQILAMDWDGDPASMLDHLHTFTMPLVDLAE